MSLKSKMLAVVLAAVIAFVCAVPGTVSAAEQTETETRTEEAAAEESTDLAQEREGEEVSPDASADVMPAEVGENSETESVETERETDQADAGVTAAPYKMEEETEQPDTGTTSAGMNETEFAAEQEPGTEAEETADPAAAGATTVKAQKEKVKMPAFSAEKKAGRYTVRISTKAGVLPEGTKAEVREVSGPAAEAYAHRAEEMAESGIATAVIDIRFTDRNGKEIQPAGMVDVVFENAAEEDAEMSVYHAEDSSADRMQMVPSNVEGEDVTISNDSFSPYVLLAAANEPDWTKDGPGTGRNISQKISLVHKNQKAYDYDSRGYDAGKKWVTISYDMYLDGRKVGRAVCLDPKLNGYELEGKAAGSVYEFTAPMLVKALYYGANGPGSDVIRKAVGTSEEGALGIVTHVAAAEIYARLGHARYSAAGDALSDASNKLKDHVYKFVRAIEDLPVPDNFYVYVTKDNGYSSGGMRHQDFGIGSYSLIPHPGSARIKKSSAEPSITDGNGCYAFNGALYQAYTSAEAAKARGSEGLVEGSLSATDGSGDSSVKAFWPGTYYWIEVRSPKGYLLSDKVYPFTVKDNSLTVVEVADPPANDPAAIVIDKTCKDAGSQKINSLEGTQFTVDYYDGYYDASSIPGEPERSWVIEVHKTQGGLFRAALDEEHLVSGDDLYKINDQVTLPLGTITIRETQAAKGYKNDGRFGDQEMYIGQIRMNSDNRAELADIQGKRGTSNSFEVSDTPKEVRIGTSAVNSASGERTACAGEEVTIEDTVTYENLTAGSEYLLKGRLVDKNTGETIKDAQGMDVTASKKFTADECDGTVVIPFTFTAGRSMEGCSAVAFETVECEGKVIASHEDLEDESQTIRFPRIRTTAVSSETGEHILRKSENARITDTVIYKNLEPGKEYTLRGTLMHSDGSGILAIDGRDVIVEKTFTPPESDGKTEVEFRFDAQGIEGSGLTVFEELFAGEKLIAAHKDIGDKEQTVLFPGISTDACDRDTKAKNTLAAEDRVIVDKITYSSLIAGKTYEISGEVKIRNDETDFDSAQTVPSAIIDAEGKGSLSFDPEKVTFVPEGQEGDVVSGEIFVSFKVDASRLAGEDLVVGETVRCKGVEIAVHRDLQDEGQTDHIPKGRTYAADKDTGIKNTLAAGNRIFRDEFRYENLLPGETYRFTGKVMAAAGTDDQGTVIMEEIPSVMTDESGAPLEKGCVEFVPSSEKGKLDLYFAIDAAELANRDVTVYEKVTLGGEPVIIHEVLDGTQTVYVPDGATTVFDTETHDQISVPDEKVSVIDTFVYKNLIPGKEYTLKGRIMKKSAAEEIPSSLGDAAFITSGEEAAIPSGSISVTDNEVTFIPDSEDGAMELTFTFDGSSLAGEDAVVFERVYYNGAEVIVHENIDDENQTVHFPDGFTEAVNPDTEGHTVNPGTDVTVRDRFYYSNLIPGDEYVIRGKVILKPSAFGTEQELAAKMVDADGNEVDEWKFTPEQKDGCEDLFFVIDAGNLAGRSAVVFETMEFIDPELQTRTVIVRHENIDDENQTVHFPGLRTNAADKEDGDKNISHKGTVSVIDSVQYRNLTPGAKYRLTGVLMDKSTGKPATSGGKEITAGTEFTAGEPDGTEQVTFTFDPSGLHDGEYVAFETLCEINKETGQEEEVGSHRDLKDASQTVKRRTPPGGTNTGDESNMLFWICVTAAAIVCAATVIIGKKKTE